MDLFVEMFAEECPEAPMNMVFLSASRVVGDGDVENCSDCIRDEGTTSEMSVVLDSLAVLG